MANYERARDQKDLKEVLKSSDLENWFDVYVDRKENKVYNMNQTVVFDVKPGSLPLFRCEGDAFWPLISYKTYGTTRLAWLLMKLNDVGPDEVFDIVESGTYIRYIPEERIHQVIKMINGYDRG